MPSGEGLEEIHGTTGCFLNKYFCVLKAFAYLGLATFTVSRTWKDVQGI